MGKLAQNFDTKLPKIYEIARNFDTLHQPGGPVPPGPSTSYAYESSNVLRQIQSYRFDAAVLGMPQSNQTLISVLQPVPSPEQAKFGDTSRKWRH